MRRVKECRTAEHEYTWLSRLPDGVKPEGLKLESPTCYSWDWVEGDWCRDWRLLHKTLADYVWGHSALGGPWMPIDLDAYKAYVFDVAERVMGSFGRRGFEMAFRAHVHVGKLTPVRNVHGDATLMNSVVKDNGDLVLLDPGFHHGLPCRELDEAKMMQSLDGWDHVKSLTTSPTPREPLVYSCHHPSKWGLLHLTLLCSHYVRLLNHPEMHHDNCIRWASNRLDFWMRLVAR